MKPLLHPTRDDISLEGVLYALGDPIRLRIVRALACGVEHPCCHLYDELPKSTLSRHFQILRETGLIRQRREGTQFLNSLRSDDLEALFPGLLSSILAAAAGQSATAK